MCFHSKWKKGMKIIAVYVDNLILIAKFLDELQQAKESLSEAFLWNSSVIALASI